MVKANIYIKINDYIIDKTGLLIDNILKVETDDGYIEYDLKKSILIKEDQELKITLDFKNKVVEYFLLKENKKFHHNFTILKLTNNDKEVIINYQIEETSFLLKIKYETI